MADDTFVLYTVECIEKYLDRKLDYKQREYSTKLISEIDPNIFIGHKMSQVGPILGKILGDKILEKRDVRKEESLDEIQQRMIAGEYNEAKTSNDLGRVESDYADKTPALVPGWVEDESKRDVVFATDLVETGNKLVKDQPVKKVVSFLGINDLQEFKLFFNPESLYTHFYISLDTNYRDKSDEVDPTAVTKMKWNYAPTQVLADGFCNSVGTIRNIVGMRLYQPRIPNVAGLDTDAKRASILIEELAAQAFVAANGRRFHFLLRPTYSQVNGGRLELSTEDYNDGIFRFRDPVTSVTSFTISIGNPLVVLAFDFSMLNIVFVIEFTCLKLDGDAGDK